MEVEESEAAIRRNEGDNSFSLRERSKETMQQNAAGGSEHVHNRHTYVCTYGHTYTHTHACTRDVYNT